MAPSHVSSSSSGSPRELATVIERERIALGALAPEDVAGLVAHLFPEELTQHRRIVDEARLLGVDGIVELAR